MSNAKRLLKNAIAENRVTEQSQKTLAIKGLPRTFRCSQRQIGVYQQPAKTRLRDVLQKAGNKSVFSEANLNWLKENYDFQIISPEELAIKCK